MLAGRGLLTPLQRTFLTAFAGLPDQGQFYLSGGTALAEFYLGHRLSFDLDLFTAQDDLILPVSYRVESLATRHGLDISVTRRFSSFVEFAVSRGEEHLRVDLALDSPFRFEPPTFSEPGILVNSWCDLKVDKLLAYYGRTEPRDAVDLFFVLKQDPLDELLALAACKDPGFDLYWFAAALNRANEFPDQIEHWPVKMLLPFDPLHLKQGFRDLAMVLMTRVSDAGSTSQAS
jgi:hypothetical protein